jgi:hypothetical protein
MASGGAGFAPNRTPRAASDARPHPLRIAVALPWRFFPGFRTRGILASEGHEVDVIPRADLRRIEKGTGKLTSRGASRFDEQEVPKALVAGLVDR